MEPLDVNKLYAQFRDTQNRMANFRIRGSDVSGHFGRGFVCKTQTCEEPVSGSGGFGGGSTPPTPTGACCDELGNCTIDTQTHCESLGRTYQGDDTNCSPNPCPSTGACCRGAVCTTETQASCEGTGGVYQGDDVPCDPNPCPTGACCNGASCSIQTEVDCVASGGTFNGGPCEPNPCSVGFPCCGGCGFGAYDGSPRTFLRQDINLEQPCRFGCADCCTVVGNCVAPGNFCDQEFHCTGSEEYDESCGLIPFSPMFGTTYSCPETPLDPCIGSTEDCGPWIGIVCFNSVGGASCSTSATTKTCTITNPPSTCTSSLTNECNADC